MKNTNVRVYTRAAQQSEQGLKEQLKSCREFCSSNGLEIVGEYSDVGSGTADRRADLQRMLTGFKENNIGCVVVHSFDRLSRDAREFVQIKDKINQQGVGLISVTEGNANGSVISLIESLARGEGTEEH